MSFKNYKDLIVWQKSMDLVIEIYSITNSFPKSELFSLTSQLKRSAISIPYNISEGHARRTSKVYINFLNISYASLAELETQIIIAYRLSYLTETEYKNVLSNIEEIGRMVNGLKKSIKSKLPSESRILYF